MNTSCSRLEVRFRLAEFPGSIKFAVYAHLTELHGKYRLELRLEDSQGDILWAVRAIRRSSTTTRSCLTASHFAT